jgi:HSP20 family protein
MYFVPVSRRPLAHDMARSLDRLLTGSLRPAAEEVDSTEARTPLLDLAETEAGYKVILDLPGVAKQDVNVSVDGRRVSIEAHGQRSDEKNEGERVIYRERAQTRYARSFTVPQDVDAAQAQARLEQGVLTLHLPKRTVHSASRITIN